MSSGHLPSPLRRWTFPWATHPLSRFGGDGFHAQPGESSCTQTRIRPPIALVDGVNGELVEFFSEPNPEKWADIGTEAIGADADPS